jgi:hypothetical protein
MPAPTASARIKRIRSNSITLITLGCAVNYVDRSTLAVANPPIRHDQGPVDRPVQDTGSFVPALLFSAALGTACSLIYIFVVPCHRIDAASFDAEVVPA